MKCEACSGLVGGTVAGHAALYDYVGRARVEALVDEVRILAARVADRDHELIRVRAELAAARAERDRLRAVVEQASRTLDDEDVWLDHAPTVEIPSSIMRSRRRIRDAIAATPAAAERPESPCASCGEGREEERKGMTGSLEIARTHTANELEHAVAPASMVSVSLATEDGETSRLTDGEYGFGGYHAVRGDRCLNIDGKAFMEAAARLVGIRLVGDMRLNDRRGLLDFDAAEKARADTTVGLEARAVRTRGRELIEGKAATLTLVEFWDMLAGIAKGQGETGETP